MDKKPFSELMTGILAACLGIAVFCYSRTLKPAELGIGAGGYLTAVGVIFIILGGIQTVLTLRSGVGKPVWHIDAQKELKVVLIILTMVVYLLLLKYLGFLIMTPLLIISEMAVFGIRNWWKSIIIALLFTLVVYFLFTEVFMVFLPRFSLF